MGVKILSLGKPEQCSMVCDHCGTVLVWHDTTVWISVEGVKLIATDYCDWHNDPETDPDLWLCPRCIQTDPFDS